MFRYDIRWCHQYLFCFVFIVSVVILNDFWSGNVLINSILNDYVWLDCCCCEVVNVCWNSLDFFVMGCSHTLELFEEFIFLYAW